MYASTDSNNATVNAGDIVAYHGSIESDFTIGVPIHGLCKVTHVNENGKLFLRGWGTRKSIVLNYANPHSVTLVKRNERAAAMRRPPSFRG